MPELAEVEFFRKRWHQSALGERVVAVRGHRQKKLLREIDFEALRAAIAGARLEWSGTSAKHMLFRFSGGTWLGIHLGMTGELRVEPPDYPTGRHDHLVLVTERHALVFNDPRMFGRVDFHRGDQPPAWWQQIAPPILSDRFTPDAVASFLARRRRSPIKAVLLMQERFPGVGNWMADEILWRAAIHPARPAGSLSPAEVRNLWRECRTVCRQALTAIAGRGDELPRDLNVNIPRSWLFHHRWRRGGLCPLTGKPLAHATIGGRTTCWSPARQKLRPRSATARQRPSKPRRAARNRTR